jgi:two-component system nitrogen regulation sensor histidine kinase NtrY
LATEQTPGAPRARQRGGLTPAERRRRRRDWWLAAVAALLLGVLIVVEPRLLALSRTFPSGSDLVFLALVNLNILGIGVLVFLVARNVGKLVVERRRGILGSKLNTKFVVSFVFMAAVSTTALFVFSAFLINRAVGSWLELQVADALGESVTLADAYYESAEGSALYFARRIAAEIEQDRLLREDGLDRLRAFVVAKQREYNLGGVKVFSARLEELAGATHPDAPVVVHESADSNLIRAGMAGEEQTVVQEAGTGEVLRAVVPIRSTFQKSDVVGAVAVNAFLPRSIGKKTAAIRSALATYRRLQPNQGAFQTNVVLVLALITVSIVLFSSWIGFRLAKQISVPIQRLAEATAEVAAGNLDVRIEQPGEDEIGMLVAAFNRMATDLASSREDLERRRAQMEILLRSVAAGVISLDRESVVQTINPSAARLLGLSRGPWAGRKVSEVLAGRALETAEDLLRRLAAGPHEMLRRQVPIAAGDSLRTLNWTASRLRDIEGGAAGFVIVLDDVTQILKVQRMAAWREVARRIAHEIKNPLTPIQLSAQRLRRKLESRLPDAESRELLVRCTDAITGQVEALKLLISEFSNFARLPATDPAPTNLNEVVADTTALYSEDRRAHVTTVLDPDVPELDLDREQIKRVILNLVENAIAAVEAAGPGPREVRVCTGFERELATVHFEVADTGVGIPADVRRRLFEPYFSTKREGSGLGLAIVSRIVSDHSGYIRVRDNQPRGTRFIVELPVRA